METKLYECAADVLAVLNHHFDDEKEQKDTLEAVIGQFEVKAQSVIAYHLNQLAELEMLDQHIKTMQQRKKTLQAQSNSLHEYLKRNMEAAGIKEIKANDGTFAAKIAKNPPSVEVFDESLLPENCFKIKKEVSKTAIKEALQKGEDVQGARLITDSTRLQIK